MSLKTYTNVIMLYKAVEQLKLTYTIDYYDNTAITEWNRKAVKI